MISSDKTGNGARAFQNGGCCLFGELAAGFLESTSQPTEPQDSQITLSKESIGGNAGIFGELFVFIPSRNKRPCFVFVFENSVTLPLRLASSSSESVG